jgi:hypothetical protein
MKRSLILSLSAPFVFILAACAPEHATVSPIKTQTTAASVNTVLNHQDWPKNEWWKAYNDPELNGLIAKALSDAPDMQIARQRITLAEAQAKAAMASDGPQIDFSADAERQKMSAEGLMGPFAITDPAAGTTGPWYTNGTFGLTAGWDLDLWGKNRAQVEARIGKVNAQKRSWSRPVSCWPAAWRGSTGSGKRRPPWGRSSRRLNMSRTILSVPIASCISTGSPPPWRALKRISTPAKPKSSWPKSTGK